MYDHEILYDLLYKMKDCINKIQTRFEPVKTVSDLTDSIEGTERLDLLCMPLIVIGEIVKKIDKASDNSFLKKYPAIPWGEIKGLRNIVAHDYFNIDAEEIFNTCKDDIPELEKTINLILSDIEMDQKSRPTQTK